MQKVQAQGGTRGHTVPGTQFQAAFPELSDGHAHRHSGPQIGQLSLHKLLEVSRELNSASTVRYRGTSDADAQNRNRFIDAFTPPGHATYARASRSQQIQRTRQDLSVTSGKHMLDRIAAQTVSVQPLPACASAMQKARAHLRSQTPSASSTQLVQQARCIPRPINTAEPVQRHSCKVHRSPSMRPSSVTSARILSDGSATAAVLLAHHRKRLMSADPYSPAPSRDSPSGRGGTPPLSAHRGSATSLPRMQQVQTAPSAMHHKDSTPSGHSLQLVQLRPTAGAPIRPSILTSATLHRHDTAELPSSPQGNTASHASGVEPGPEDSESSGCCTDTADNGQMPGSCPEFGSSGLDFDDCLSVGTSQGITHCSSSLEPADTAEGISLRADNPSKATGGHTQGKAGPWLGPSIMGTAATVAFVGLLADPDAESALIPLRGFTMKVKYAGIANNAVRAAFQNAGFKKTSKPQWNVLWSKALKPEAYSSLTKFQKANHFPGTWQLGRKDKLYTNIARAKRMRGSFFDVISKVYILPRDGQELLRHAAANPDQLYIQKPLASSRGRGIKLVPDPATIPADKACLVQHYISNPHTINGHKYDLRVYALVTCLNPLRVYLYEEGLVRFASEPFTLHRSKLRRRCVHVTNYSVNKHQPGFVANTDADSDGVGSKWSLRALQEHLENQCGVQWHTVWTQVQDLVVAAILAAEPELHSSARMHVPHRTSCFEIFGVDILLDDAFRAWLIEVNTGPDLSSTSPLDKQLKHKMVAQMMHLVGVIPYDRERYLAQQKLLQTARITGLPLSPTANMASSGRTLASCGSWSVSSSGSLVGGGGTLASCGSVAGRPQTVPVSPSRLGMRRSADSLPLAADASTSGRRDDLSELVYETLAEEARANQWQRVFPCSTDPMRYLDKFEMQRADTNHVCQALKDWHSKCSTSAQSQDAVQSSGRAWR